MVRYNVFDWKNVQNMYVTNGNQSNISGDGESNGVKFHLDELIDCVKLVATFDYSHQLK